MAVLRATPAGDADPGAVGRRMGPVTRIAGRGPDRSEKGRQEALLALYAELPKMVCQGLCSDSCSSLVQTRLERDLIAERTGVRLQLVQRPPAPCAALTMLNQCGVYDTRPMICRLWGMTSGLRCQYGCEPEGGYLTGQQFYEFLARAAELAGDPREAARMREPFRRNPERAERMMLSWQRHRDLDYADKVRRAGDAATFVVGPGRLSKRRPRGGTW